MDGRFKAQFQVYILIRAGGVDRMLCRPTHWAPGGAETLLLCIARALGIFNDRISELTQGAMTRLFGQS